MTTSYILQRQAELKEMKRLERQVEQSMMAKAMSDAIERHAADKARVYTSCSSCCSNPKCSSFC